jgi:5-methylcytosine-specific restriction endonuclease McrA
MPKFYLRKISHPKYQWEVVDGQQRMGAIVDFISNKYPLGSSSKHLPTGNLEGKYFKELSAKEQDIVMLYHIVVVEIDNASDIEIRHLFLRLQEGEQLNPPEKRNAMTGNMRDFVSSLTKHRVFRSIKVKNTRFKWDDYAAHVTCLEIGKHFTDVGAKDLKEMYERNQHFSITSKQAKKVQKVLNIMAKVLKDKPPEMNIKWGFVDLYCAISKLSEEFVLTNRELEIAEFFVSFETDRRKKTKDPAALISGNYTEWDRDLYDYIQAFQKEGAKRKNLQIRHDVYRKRILDKIGDLSPKDKNRVFSTEEKIIIWRRDNGECKQCGKSVLIEDMHADHIKPHSKGGFTIIENGQTLCQNCNLTKGAKI